MTIAKTIREPLKLWISAMVLVKVKLDYLIHLKLEDEYA
jgi:hypothetical protein